MVAPEIVDGFSLAAVVPMLLAATAVALKKTAQKDKKNLLKRRPDFKRFSASFGQRLFICGGKAKYTPKDDQKDARNTADRTGLTVSWSKPNAKLSAGPTS